MCFAERRVKAMSIRLRLTLWYSSLLAVTLLVFGVTVYLFINWSTYTDLKTQLKKQSESLPVVSWWNFFENQMDLDIDPRRTSIEQTDMYIQIVNYKEGVIKQSSNLMLQNFNIPYPDASHTLVKGFVKSKVEVNKKKYTILSYQRPLFIGDGTLVGLLQVGAIPYSEEKFLGGVRTTLTSASLFVIFVAFTIGLLIARQALRPIERVIQATKQIEKGSDLSVRIPPLGPKDEIGTLVDTLNMMLSRLETAYNELDEAYTAQRRFVSDASHELRTPLTTIRGNIDLLERMWTKQKESSGQSAEEWLPLTAEHWSLSKEAMDDISAEAKRMSTLVSDLLALARADAGYVMEKQQLDLLPLTEEVVRRSHYLPREADWRIGDLSVLQGVQVYGNHDYLQQLLFIFIENAFKYTEEGYVELNAVLKERHVGISIRDTGIGMNPEEIPHIFDRFYRADESRGVTVGTGLGLSIAKWIIDEHEGSVEVITREGDGTNFTIWLPIAFADAAPSSIIEEKDTKSE